MKRLALSSYCLSILPAAVVSYVPSAAPCYSSGSVGRRLCTLTMASSAASSSAQQGVKLITVKSMKTEEDVIKKSKFIGTCVHAGTFAEAEAFLNEVVREHPKARHWCWAWKGVDGEHRYSDDGEPGGTAGQPILTAIEGEGLSQTMVVVTRYFGGIKLGTGGLCRAYGGTAALAVRAAEKEVRLPMTTLLVTAPMAMVGSVYKCIHNCTKLCEEYTADSNVKLTVSCETSAVEALKVALLDATKGQGVTEEGEP